MQDRAIANAGQALKLRTFDPVSWLDQILQRDTVWHFAIALLLALQASLILTHAHWLDEWQAMQIAADSPDLPALLENLRYEGHPPLWYLLLQLWYVFLPFHWVLKGILLPIAAITQVLILFRSPFTRGEKMLIASGALMLFEYLTISRSLSLGVMMLVIMMASWRQQRTPWIAIALLPMCDFLFGVLSVFAALARWNERKIWWPGAALWLLSGLLAAWTVRPAADMSPAIALDFQSKFSMAIQYLGTALIPIQAEGFNLQWRTSLPYGLGAIAAPIFLWFAYHQTKEDRSSSLVFFSFVGVILAFSLAVYPLEFRHVSLAALLLILLRWRLSLGGSLPDKWFRLWLLIGAMCGLLISAYALKTPFDRAPEVAKRIADKKLKNERWLVFPDSRALGVSALNNMHFERLDQRCRTSFVRWNLKTPIGSFEDLESKLNQYVAEAGGGYLLTDIPLTELPKGLVTQIAFFPAGHSGYDYYLFKVGTGISPMARASLCVSTMPGVDKNTSRH